MYDPIRVIDFETTGTDPETSAICEIGWCDVVGERVVVPEYAGGLTNPGQPIPPEARAIHHISNTDIRNAPPPGAVLECAVTPDIAAFAAHNARFEQGYFQPAETPWICTYKAALRLWPEAPSHGNQVLRYWLGLDDNADFSPELAMPPHRALPDAYVTAHILREQLRNASIDDLIRWSAEPALLPTIRFGKHRGTPFSEVPVDYLEWISRQADMGEDVRHTAQHHIDRRRGNGDV